MAGRAQELTEHISSLSHLAGPAARKAENLVSSWTAMGQVNVEGGGDPERRAERIQEDSDRGPIGIGWSRTRRSSVAGLGECRADGLGECRGARKAMGRGQELGFGVQQESLQGLKLRW